ncbi:unnamed protein product [Meganyctiphanes norvegica]|uniref:Uncharacterized protein n=1 Tax=Meganyctiphanes norvegica TaxID=48144 RepID=A0AAV2R7W9_MEGNR
MCLLITNLINYFNNKNSYKVLMVGLKTPRNDTVILNREMRSFNVEVVQYQNVKLEAWNLRGVDVTSAFWSHHLTNTCALVMFIHTGRQDTLHHTRHLLQGLTSLPDLKACPLLFLDSNTENPYPSEKLLKEILLLSSNNRPCHVANCNSNNGWEGGWGSFDGLNWLVAQLRVGKHNTKQKNVQNSKSNELLRTDTWTISYSTNDENICFKKK